MDKRFCDIVLVTAAFFIGIPVLTLIVYCWWEAGIWPFRPLKPRLEIIELQNGGKIEIEYTPWRDLLDSGWHAKARYLLPYNKSRENIGQWFDCGYNTNLQAYALNDKENLSRRKAAVTKYGAGCEKSRSFTFPKWLCTNCNLTGSRARSFGA